jgi:hypothetical protein
LAVIAIPDSKLAREITDLVRDTESELLFTIRAASTTSARWPASIAA